VDNPIKHKMAIRPSI